MSNLDKILLSVKDLKTTFKTEEGIITAVDNIAFDINKGESIGIVGESGSGKSVSSLSIMQLLSQHATIESGSIIFNSRRFGMIDLVNTEESMMRRIRGNEIAMIFQEPMTSLNPVFKCGDQIKEVILLHSNFGSKMAKEIILELFEMVQLPDPLRIYKSYPHELSGGQKQRVMIAMAMACNPSLLIADEPTTALDVTVQKNILELMNQLSIDVETSIIFITHDLGVVAEIADKVIVMNHGKIVEQGKTIDIFSNPQHPYTKGLLACRPKLDMNLEVLPVVSDFMEYDESGNIVEKPVLSESEILSQSMRRPTDARFYKDRDILLSVKNLKVHFGKSKGFSFIKGDESNIVKAVDDVSFDVYKGETLGLVGESGCGKTTLGRAILGLIKTTSGEVTYGVNKINNVPESHLRKHRKDLQIIFQDPYSSLNPRKSIGNAIIEPMKTHHLYSNDDERKEVAFELLKKVGLSSDHYNRYPHEFSGGQRQRICIARALALNPKFIVCDESVSALDVSVQAQVLNLLNNLKKEFGFTYIFVSHDLSVVKFMSDRIIVMNKGKIEEMGFSEEIYQNPKSDYTKKLIDSIPQGRIEDVRRYQVRKKIKKAIAE